MSAEALPGLLRSFRLPTVASIWEESVVRAEQENWGYRRLLQHLFESEAQDRRERKMTRLLKASGLPDGKALGNLDEKLLTAKIRRLWPTLLEGHFVERAENLIVIGLPGRGKTHFLAALGRELILRHRMAVLSVPTFKLVQGLLVAKKALRLEAELQRLDRYPAIVLDDFGYVQQDREEMEVLFTFLAERYERRSVLISTNLVFSQWEQIFKDPIAPEVIRVLFAPLSLATGFTGEATGRLRAEALIAKAEEDAAGKKEEQFCGEAGKKTLPEEDPISNRRFHATFVSPMSPPDTRFAIGATSPAIVAALTAAVK